jgi:hypothetical protein
VIRALLAIAAAAIAIYYLWRVRSMPPHKQRSGYIKFLLGLMIALVVVLTLTGRMHWVGAAITGAFVFLRQILPWIIRALPFLNKLREQNTQSGESSIQTNHLSATLDHGSGHIDGEIIEGPHKGWLLSELSIMQLEDLLTHYQTEDEESAELLEAYIDQRRQQADQNTEQQRTANRAASDQSARAEALAILGLDEGSTEEEVVSAHRSLIQKLHPDRGGNDFLAAKINQAKDILLKKN